jgi:hypothetical protein
LWLEGLLGQVVDRHLKGTPGRVFLFCGAEVENPMIVRMWHGRVDTVKAKAYASLLKVRAPTDYRAVPGNLSAHILERQEGDVAHFMALTFVESLDAIEGFAGEDVRRRSTTRRTGASCSRPSQRSSIMSSRERLREHDGSRRFGKIRVAIQGSHS